MKYLDYREPVRHGTFDFPIALYQIDAHHPQYEMMYHWHPECEIIRVCKGKFSITLDSREILAEAGDILYITDGVLHGGHAVTDCVYECIVFDAKGVTSGNHASLRQMQNILDHKRVIRPLLTDCDAELRGIVSALFDAMDLRFPGYEFTVTGALMQFYGYVFRHHLYSVHESIGPKFREQQRMLRGVITFIEENYTEKITLADLAKQAGMSPKYFCAVFYKMTRKTPVDYLNTYRVECASEKLITTGGSVTEIAFQCGFNDVSYFTKTFKKYKNTTPVQYRRTAAE